MLLWTFPNPGAEPPAGQGQSNQGMGNVESAAHGSSVTGILLVETGGLPVCPRSAWRECAAISVAKMGAARLKV
jgi:hypothetical protein